MKKIFEKPKHKIIRKLGGYIGQGPADIFKVYEYKRKYVRLSAGYFRNHPDLVDEDGKVLEFIYKELAANLAAKLLEEDLITFIEYPKDGVGRVRIEAVINVEDPRPDKEAVDA